MHSMFVYCNIACTLSPCPVLSTSVTALIDNVVAMFKHQIVTLLYILQGIAALHRIPALAKPHMFHSIAAIYTHSLH